MWYILYLCREQYIIAQLIMKCQNLKYVLSAFLLAVPFAASANMVWPSLYIVGQYYSWYVILAGLLIETIAAHIF